MPIALFIAGNFWLAAALTFGVGCTLVRSQPDMYGFLGKDPWFYPRTYYACLFMLVAATVICFVLSYQTWRRQNNLPMRSTGAAGAFPVIPTSDESRPRH